MALERVRVSEASVASAERFTKRVCFNHPQVLVFVLTFSPGQTLPPHRHPGSTVLLHGSSGSGMLTVEGQEQPITAGDLVLITGDEELAVRNTGTTALVLTVSLSPNPSNPAFARELR